MTEKQADQVPVERIELRAERHLIAPTPRYLLAPFMEPAGEHYIDRLREDRDVQVVRVVKPAERAGVQAPAVLVAEITQERAARLAAVPELITELDQPLRYGSGTIPMADPGVTPYDQATELTIEVRGTDGEPLAGALVQVIALTASAPALTDGDGRATVLVAGHEIESVAGLVVRAPHDHWSCWLARPRLSPTGPNRVTCTKIDPSAVDNWSRRAMGFDRLPPTYRGHGVRVAVIDSGAAVSHPDLADRVAAGRDLVAGDDKSWQQDAVGLGTAAVGLIVAAEASGRYNGLAPEAEVHVHKVFPAGRCSDLFEAIDRCIAEQMDVILLAPGCLYPSWLVAAKLDEARQAGIACIAGAGNTGGPVAFPASLPFVLGVGAIGKLGTFPADSYHATQFTGMHGPEGYFPARFTPAGPEVDLCAPGVAVICAAPPVNVAALDGTSIAAAHVAALATLVLAHHPDFRTVFQMRNAARVDRLFELLRASSRPLPYVDRLRVGRGLPDALVAVGMGPGAVRPAWAFGGVPLMTPVG